ncbi:hypothetical protein MJO28_010944 [Puccinia striiformis f. sp. tritici]|uniref:Uncharacterized protein n=1 Tax=Puccinia striiformis f. sp. tritici TaxID=168172 RepID=A0ACC0E7J0_9BASI|nr:hypothetical protein Pst134EA_019756 [Puccinia striiformis f. sp. tritici]KAH9459616.1 hypothetical protein Pst134EA_019756 [Puccinia striiformis f. sp. tritici]KAI7945249.1 hypothetical protein MJO28_010944 [Puccinia striiformis f. sp. tritici]KAI7949019.1 hypothetical protein MJO29_010684 [Puccinia striiformis f. sp. tritici]
MNFLLLSIFFGALVAPDSPVAELGLEGDAGSPSPESARPALTFRRSEVPPEDLANLYTAYTLITSDGREYTYAMPGDATLQDVINEMDLDPSSIASSSVMYYSLPPAPAKINPKTEDLGYMPQHKGYSLDHFGPTSNIITVEEAASILENPSTEFIALDNVRNSPIKNGTGATDVMESTRSDTSLLEKIGREENEIGTHEHRTLTEQPSSDHPSSSTPEVILQKVKVLAPGEIQCAICLVEYKPPKKVADGRWDFEHVAHLENCGHCFHPPCIVKWFKSGAVSSCPICRRI